MDLSKLSSSSLNSLVALVEKREALADELAQLDATITAALGGKVTEEKAPQPAPSVARRKARKVAPK